MHNVFISFHHTNDHYYKDELLRQNRLYNIFNDKSVDTNSISDDLDEQTIRQIIRDQYLRNSTVTILLIGTETQKRKHVDWEIYSSMINGQINDKSGIIAINLPETKSYGCQIAHEKEKEIVHPGVNDWTNFTKAELTQQFPFAPDRIIDNLYKKEAKISILSWQQVNNRPDALRYLIDATHHDRVNCEYDLSRKMRRHNS